MLGPLSIVFVFNFLLRVPNIDGDCCHQAPAIPWPRKTSCIQDVFLANGRGMATIDVNERVGVVNCVSSLITDITNEFSSTQRFARIAHDEMEVNRGAAARSLGIGTTSVVVPIIQGVRFLHHSEAWLCVIVLAQVESEVGSFSSHSMWCYMSLSSTSYIGRGWRVCKGFCAVGHRIPQIPSVTKQRSRMTRVETHLQDTVQIG